MRTPDHLHSTHFSRGQSRTDEHKNDMPTAAIKTIYALHGKPMHKILSYRSERRIPERTTYWGKHTDTRTRVTGVRELSSTFDLNAKRTTMCTRDRHFYIGIKFRFFLRRLGSGFCALLTHVQQSISFVLMLYVVRVCCVCARGQSVLTDKSHRLVLCFCSHSRTMHAHDIQDRRFILLNS